MVEVMRNQWCWSPPPNDEDLARLGCADDIEALLAAIEVLATTGGVQV